MPGPEDFFSDLVPVLDEIGVSWAVIGALAALRYRSTARTTTDADLLISWDASVPGALRAEGWELRVMGDPGDPPHLIRARRGGADVDLLVALTEYQQVALERATDHVLTVEDVLVHKLIAWRGRDREDIESILATGRTFDRSYVARWVREFGFEDRLAAAGIE